MEILIEDGVKRKCPFCNSIYAIDNGEKVLLRNISLVYLDRGKSLLSVKCKQCKQIIALPDNN